MEKDAMTAGVERGGLISVAEIRVLICYILSSISDPVPGKQLADMLHYEGIANCFEVNDSIAHLVDAGQIKYVSEADDTYTVTPQGRSSAKTLEHIIPFSIKEKAYFLALKMVSRLRSARETDIKISSENNSTYITCSALDGEQAFMSVKLLVSDETQAKLIKERFLDDPAKIYNGIIDLLTK